MFAPNGRTFVVVCFVNHPNAARAQVPLDVLVEWVYAVARRRRRALMASERRYIPGIGLLSLNSM